MPIRPAKLSDTDRISAGELDPVMTNRPFSARRSALVDRHPQGGKQLGENLGLVQRHVPGVQTEEQIRVAGDHGMVRPPLQIKLLPPGRKGVKQGRLPALPNPQQGDAGKRRQVGLEQRRGSPFHDQAISNRKVENAR